jgi:hypothetical protein
MKKVIYWLAIAALLLTPVVAAIQDSRFMVLLDCGTLKGEGAVHLRDREKERGYRLDIKCSGSAPTVISFL